MHACMHVHACMYVHVYIYINWQPYTYILLTIITHKSDAEFYSKNLTSSIFVKQLYIK